MGNNKLMDKNGKLFGKISIVDLTVILLILVVASGTVYRFTSNSTTQFGTSNATVLFTIRISNVRDFTLDYYEEGLRVYDRVSNDYLGHIVSIESEPYYDFRHLFDGTLAEIPHPERINIYIDILASGRISDNAIFVEGNYEVTVGSFINIITKYVEVSGRIHSLEIMP